MNYIKKLVSGKRRRFQDGQYDLDITYITPRVIAMSFPASSYVETTYRNSASEVILLALFYIIYRYLNF